MGRKGSVELHVATFILLGFSVVPAACQTAYIVPSQQADFNPDNHTYNHLAYAAADAGYDVILLVGDFRVQPALWPESHPVRRSRNLTISSFNYAEESYALLELEFLEARFVIAANVRVQLKDIAVGRARKSSGQQLPFFAGEGQGSILELNNVARLRTACANDSYDLAAALVEGFRSGPGEVGTGSNLAYVETFKWRGQLYPNSLHADDVSTFVNPGDVTETRSIDAGYTLLQENTTRVCLAYVDPACVAQQGVDACVVALVDQILASEDSTGGRQSIAKIVAPVVVAGVLLPAAVIGFLLYRRNRRRCAQQELLPDTERALHAQERQQQVALLARGNDERGSGAQGAPSHKSMQNDKQYDVGSSDDQDAADAQMPGPDGGASGTLEASAVGGARGGWQLLACHTSPEFKDATTNDRIKLGVLLGAGSFGRVYKGRWHNMDVAVKVLQHDSTTAAAISNEVDLVMSFRHPNIVAAYHFVTWTQQPADDGVASPTGRGRSRLMPVVESAYSDGTYDASLTNTHSTLSFRRPPAVVIAGKDGSTMSSLPTVRSRTTSDPIGASSGTGTLVGTDNTTKSSNSGSSSSDVQAMMAVPSNPRERDALTETNGDSIDHTGLGRVAGALGPTAAAMALNATSTSTHVAVNPSPGPGQLDQGSIIPVTREGAEGSGLGSGKGYTASSGMTSPIPGPTTLTREGSSGLRFNSNGSNLISTGSSTAAVAAILAAGRQGGRGSPAITARTPLPGSQLRLKSPAAAAAAAAAGGAVQAVSTLFGAQCLQQHVGSQQQPTSAVTPAAATQQQQQQQSSGVSKISDEMIVDIQTPSQPYVVTDKLTSLMPIVDTAAPAAVAARGLAAADPSAAAAAAARPAAGSIGDAAGPHGVTLQLPASALRQPRDYSVASTAAASASLSPHPVTSAQANFAGSSGRQQRQQGPGDQQISGSDAFANPPGQLSYGNVGSDASTVAGPHPVVETESAVKHFVPFTSGQLMECEQQSSTAGSSSRSASVVHSGSRGTAAAAGLAAQPSSRSQSCALVSSPSAATAAAAGFQLSQSSGSVSGITTPDQIQQQQQQPASGSDQTSSHTPKWHVLGDISHKDAKPPCGATTAAAAPSAAADVADPAAAAKSSQIVLQPANFNDGGFAGMSNLTSSSLSTVGRPVGRTGARQPSEAQTWLILEYCNGGTLLDLLQDGQLGQQSASPTSRRKHAFMLTLLSDVAAGMVYLHRRNVLHGDLKPGNILIRYESGLPYGRAAKVSDFGLCRALNVGQSHRSTRTMGTMNHTPPELLRLGRLSPAGDVYAFGIIMWEVYTGEVAFHGLHYGEVFEQVALWQKRPPVPDDMPKDYVELMIDCWAADPFRRPTFDVILDKLKKMLDRVVQDAKEAEDRFVSDL